MADPVAKFLARVTKVERALLLDLVSQIIANDGSSLQVKKLVGSKDIYRVRKGNFRIVYKKTKTDCVIGNNLRHEVE